MSHPRAFYELLLDYARTPELVEEVLIGQVWTLCRAGGAGLCMTPQAYTRTLPWAGTLRGKPLAELASWVMRFEPHEAAVGMAAVNAALAGLEPPLQGQILEPAGDAPANLAVFEHFRPQLAGRRVVVVGRYPGLHEWAARHDLRMDVLEREPVAGDWPDPAAEFLLPEADWVFLTASSIPNKTFPRLAELSRDATVVLMGPTTPWIPDLVHFGIDYLAGVEVVAAETLREIVAEGGGVRLFDAAVRYRVAPLSPTATQEWTRALIAHAYAEKTRLTREMELWYETHPRQRYPAYDRLEVVNRRLSRLDSCFKTLWDERPPAIESPPP